MELMSLAAGLVVLGLVCRVVVVLFDLWMDARG